MHKQTENKTNSSFKNFPVQRHLVPKTLVALIKWETRLRSKGECQHKSWPIFILFYG